MGVAERPLRDAREPIQLEFHPARAPGYAALVVLSGEHDLATHQAIRAALAPLSGNLLVDLSDCEFIDSTVIGTLLEKYEDLRREGQRLELIVPLENQTVRRVVDVTGLDTLMTVHDGLPLPK